MIRLQTSDYRQVSTFTLVIRATYTGYNGGEHPRPTNIHDQTVSFTVVPQCFTSKIIGYDYQTGVGPKADCYLKYGNGNQDLVNAFCGGNYCYSAAHKASLVSHWNSSGKNELHRPEWTWPTICAADGFEGSPLHRMKTMSVPLNGFLKIPFIHYTHTYRNTWIANYPGKDRCVISYRTDGTDRDSRGILFKVYNSTREVELYTPDDNKIGTRIVNVIAYYSAWSDRHQPNSNTWHYQRIKVTIEKRCVITEYLPSVIISADHRYQIAVDPKLELPFEFKFKPANCNYY